MLFDWVIWSNGQIVESFWIYLIVRSLFASILNQEIDKDKKGAYHYNSTSSYQFSC